MLNPPTHETDRAVGNLGVVDAVKARYRSQQRGLTRAVGAENADQLSTRDAKRNALKGGDRPLVHHLQLVDGEQRCRHLPAEDSGLCLNGQSRKYVCTRRQMPTSPRG